LQPLQIPFLNYNQRIFFTKGVTQVTVEYQGIEKNPRVVVIDRLYAPLLGHEWIRTLKVNLEELEEKRGLSSGKAVNQITLVGNEQARAEILSKYADVFQKKIGMYPKC